MSKEDSDDETIDLSTPEESQMATPTNNPTEAPVLGQRAHCLIDRCATCASNKQHCDNCRFSCVCGQKFKSRGAFRHHEKKENKTTPMYVTCTVFTIVEN